MFNSLYSKVLGFLLGTVAVDEEPHVRVMTFVHHRQQTFCVNHLLYAQNSATNRRQRGDTQVVNA